MLILKLVIGLLVTAYFLVFAIYAVAAIVAAVVEGVRRVREGGWKALRINMESGNPFNDGGKIKPVVWQILAWLWIVFVIAGFFYTTFIDPSYDGP